MGGAAEGSSRLTRLSTASLVDKAGSGDAGARDALYDRYLPRMQRWARGRLAGWAQDLIDTDRLVHDTLEGTLHRGRFSSRDDRAFLGDVRQSIDERIDRELDRLSTSASNEDSRASSSVEDGRTSGSPAEQRNVELYDAAFHELELSDQAAIVARLEEGLSYVEIAGELGEPNEAAARLAVSRALLNLAREMKRLRNRG